jgi:phospholipase D1/2
VFPLASRQHDVPTFVHSKVMIVDDVLARIGSANFSERSLGLDTECDLAADAGEDGDRRAGVLRIRNRLLGEHLGMSSEDVAREIEQRGSMRALIDARKDAERTLVLIDLTKAPTEESPLLREVADPGAPISLAEPIAAAVPQGGVLANALRTLLGVLPGSPRVSRDRARAQFW